MVYLLGMNPSATDPQHRLRLALLVAGGLIVVLLVGIGIYGVILGPRPPETPAGTGKPTPTTPTTPSPTDARRQPPAVQGSTDPDVFARNVATTLFTWDTGSGLMPLDYSATILAVGDPSGTEQAGLASDLSAYLPSREAWIDLRKYATTQTLSITTTFVPDSWHDAVSQAKPGQIPTGALAITIEGIRHRAGVWNDEPVTAERDVAFTVFVACPPGAASCHLLRLSQLDNPLR